MVVYVLLGLHQPALRGENGAFVLGKRGLHQPDPTGYKWRKGLHQPLRFRPARPHGVQLACLLVIQMVPDLINPTLQDWIILIYVDFKRKLF